MSDLDDAAQPIAGWLQPLPDEGAPCGPDLEYDNEFLALTQAAAGRPESQFGPAEPPDWPRTLELAARLLDRSRDLRLAVTWLRAAVHLFGYPALGPGLRLVAGLLDGLWDTVHPLPDPDDGDPYGRVNALTLLAQPAGLLGDLRAARVVSDRAVGELTARQVELAAGLAEPVGDEAVASPDTLRRMLLAAIERDAAVRAAALEAVDELARVRALAEDRLGHQAPDLGPLGALVAAVAALARDDEATADADGAPAGEGGEGAGDGACRGLSGGVHSRADALRAIDLVCEYLERHEPTNPAPLFLRRARQLVDHNFLQLMKELAPDALPGVARMVGVDPDSVQSPGEPSSY